jgi:hypothetical protein
MDTVEKNLTEIDEIWMSKMRSRCLMFELMKEGGWSRLGCLLNKRGDRDIERRQLATPSKKTTVDDEREF